jgi:chromosome segregation ATPase
MALSRKFMQGMGLTEEQASAIIEANEETISGLKAEIEKNQKEAEKAQKELSKAQKELGDLKKEAEESDGKNPYKVKYDAIKEEFENYKKDIKSKETKAAKEDAYRALLKEVGVSEKRIPAVLKVTDINSLELDENGAFKDVAELKKSIKEEWSDFIPTEGTKGADTSTPPQNNGGSTMTKEQIRQISDPVARQKAMAENPALFGLS